MPKQYARASDEILDAAVFALNAVLSMSSAVAIASLLESLPLFSTKKEVATLLRVSPRTVERMITRGMLRVIKLHAAGSGRVLIPRDELARLLESRA